MWLKMGAAAACSARLVEFWRSPRTTPGPDHLYGFQRSSWLALGVLVARAATGRLPFGTGAGNAVAYRVMSTDPPQAWSMHTS
ncbi:hypothetical protein [Streptomyces turgidiscabies]|uniref:Uncharacterized protein n=1 Tax=Streptomyces turgidiscabies TaxID=85558 RepID=A0ABU0RUE0_9ACTN|nr:hypothetical protein [Streptomyces turgidiscabies]MDQ0934772.1 hypothetical protein [Streptomyces turgidiscabies]